MAENYKITEKDLFGIHIMSEKQIQKQKKSEQMKKSWRFIKNMRIVGYRAFDYINDNKKLLTYFYVLYTLYKEQKNKDKNFINFKIEKIIQENYEWLQTHKVILRFGKYKLIEV